MEQQRHEQEIQQLCSEFEKERASMTRKFETMHLLSKEQIQRRDSLEETFLDGFPLLVGNDSRKRIKREDSLCSLTIRIDGEGDSLHEEIPLQGSETDLHFALTQSGRISHRLLVKGTRRTTSADPSPIPVNRY